MNFIDYTIVAGFFIFIFSIGSYFYKWVEEPDDFFIAGRQLTPFILAATITVTNMYLYNFVGEAGQAYKEGISIVWHEWTGNMALAFSGLFIIPIMRRLRIRTIPEVIEKRYNKVVRILVSIIWMIRFCGLLGIVLYLGGVVIEEVTGFHSYSFWILILAIISVAYTFLGGMWSVTFTNTTQFILMLSGSLIVVPIIMSAVGWFPEMVKQLPDGHLNFIPSIGKFDWKFVLAIWLIGFEWASTDQGMLQMVFGAKNTKAVAKGLVLAGIILTPFNLLMFFPGLAGRVLYPGINEVDAVIPILYTNILPHIVLGFIVVGFIASELSTISSNINAIATLFTVDVYKSFLKSDATKKQMLNVVRIMTIFAGISMIISAFFVKYYFQSAVDAWLFIMSFLDMPLFVVLIIYGFFWKRATWQGALFGYLGGALSGLIIFLVFDLKAGYDFATVTFSTIIASLIICPIVSLLTKPAPEEKIKEVWDAKKVSEEEIKSNEIFHIIPISFWGRFCIGLILLGLIMFVVSVIMGSMNIGNPSLVGISGMITYFVGCFARLYFE